MSTNEILTCLALLMCSGLALTFYLMKNAPLDPDEAHIYDAQPIGASRTYFNIAIPILVAAFMAVLGVMLSDGLLW